MSRMLMHSAVERQCRGSTHLLVLVFGAQGDIAARVEEDFYVFARSPLFRSESSFPLWFLLSISLITSRSGRLLNCMHGNGAFVMEGGLQ